MKILIALLAVALAASASEDVDASKKPTFWLSVSDDSRPMLVKATYDVDGKLADCEAVEMTKGGADEDEASVENESTGDGAADADREERACTRFAQYHQSTQAIAEAQSKAQETHPQHSRAKRSYLIWPGTNWCGKGTKAEFAESYGEHQEADKCCQRHDQCPYLIEGFTTRFNLFNYRIHTLSHCDCDVQFMDCLKAANTSTATTVAKVYFNVVNTECFDLKLQKTCVRRSWWGKCEKYATKWTAGVRSLGNFPVD